MKINLKTYNKLSNIEVHNPYPCYLTKPEYFFRKIEGGDEKSYNFLHAKKFIKEFVEFFNIPESKKLIMKMIKAKKTDNEIWQELNIENELSLDYDFIEKKANELMEGGKSLEIGRRKMIKGAEFLHIKDIENFTKMPKYDIIYYHQTHFRYDSVFAESLLLKCRLFVVIDYDCENIEFSEFLHLCNATHLKFISETPLTEYTRHLKTSHTSIITQYLHYPKKKNPMRNYAKFCLVKSDNKLH